MNETIPLKIAIYTRVSTEEQAERGYSLDEQLRHLRNYVAMRELWSIAGEYIDDGYSGREVKNRPNYQHMLQDIKKWDGILVMKMDRIHRNSKNQIEMMDFLNKKDKQFISVNESLDTSNAMGRFVAYIIGGIAQLESEQTGERTYLAMKAKAKLKGFTGHRAPIGYKCVKTGLIGNGGKNLSKLVPIPETLKIVKEIFKLYNEGLSMPEIVKKFEGVKVQAGNKTKPIVLSTVQYILRNPLYVGYYKWHDILKKADDIEPIISTTLWDLVQKKKAVTCNQNGPRVKPKYRPLLIKDKPLFEIPKERIKDMPAIHRAKHNLSF